MAADIGQARPIFDKDQPVFREFMRTRSYFLGFFVAVMLKSDGTSLERIDNVAVPDLKLPKADEFAAAQESGDGICLRGHVLVPFRRSCSGTGKSR